MYACTHSPWHSEQVLEDLPVVLRLGPLPPGGLGKGEDGPAPPVPAPGHQDQLLLHLAHDVDAAEAVDTAGTWKKNLAREIWVHFFKITFFRKSIRLRDQGISDSFSFI